MLMNDAGHFDLILGRDAQQDVFPRITEWLRARKKKDKKEEEEEEISKRSRSGGGSMVDVNECHASTSTSVTNSTVAANTDR